MAALSVVPWQHAPPPREVSIVSTTTAVALVVGIVAFTIVLATSLFAVQLYRQGGDLQRRLL